MPENVRQPGVPSGTPLQVAATLVVAMLLAGCDTTSQDRVMEFNKEGTQLYNQGDFQAARENFEEALELKPGDADLLYNVAQCFDRQGNWPKAEVFYRQCLDREPEHEDARFALALVLDRTGRRDEAARLAQEWLTAHPERAAPYALDGWRLRQERAFPQAQGRLQQALAIDPHCNRALIELGVLYEQMQRPERARVLYERALARKPNQPEVVERLNDLLQKNVGRPLPDR